MADNGVAIFQLVIDASGAQIGAKNFTQATDSVASSATAAAAATDKLSDSSDDLRAALAQQTALLQQLNTTQQQVADNTQSHTGQWLALAAALGVAYVGYQGISAVASGTVGALSLLNTALAASAQSAASLFSTLTSGSLADHLTAEAQAASQSLADLARQTGLSVAALYSMADVQKALGTSTSQTQSTFLGVAAAIGNIGTSAAAARDAAAALGVDLSAYSDDQVPQAIDAITNALSHYADSAAKTALIKDIFGSDAPDFLRQLATSQAAYNAAASAHADALALMDQRQADYNAELADLGAQLNSQGWMAWINAQIKGINDLFTLSQQWKDNQAIIAQQAGQSWSIFFLELKNWTLDFQNAWQGVVTYVTGSVQNLQGVYDAPSPRGDTRDQVPQTAAQKLQGASFLGSLGDTGASGYVTFETNMKAAATLYDQGTLSAGKYADAVNKIEQTYKDAIDPIGKVVAQMDAANALFATPQGPQRNLQQFLLQQTPQNDVLSTDQTTRLTNAFNAQQAGKAGDLTTSNSSQIASLNAQAAAALYSAGAVEKLQAQQTAYQAVLAGSPLPQSILAENELAKAQAQRQLTTNTLLRTDAGEVSANVAIAQAYQESTAAGVKEEATQKALLDVKNLKIAAGSAEQVSEAALYVQVTASIAAGEKQADGLQQQVDASGRLAAAAGVSSQALADMTAHNQAVAKTATEMATAIALGSASAVTAVQALQDRYENLYQQQTVNNQTQAANSQIQANSQNLQLLQLQLDTMSQMPGVREQSLAVAKEQLAIENSMASISPALKQTLLDQAAAQGQLTGAIQETQRQQQVEAQLARNLLQGVQQSFSDFFAAILEGGTSTWATLFKSLETLAFKTLADILSATLLRPIAGSVLSALNLGSLGNSLGGGSSGGGMGSLLSLFGGGSSGSPLQVTDASGNVIGTVSGSTLSLANTNASSGSSGSSSLLSDASTLFGLGRNINSLFGGSGSSLFSGDGAFGGSAINDLFGGSGSSLFSGSGAFSASSINQLGANYLGLASGQITPEAMAAADASPELLVGAGVDGTVDAAGTLGAATLSDALPYVGAVITLAQAIASGNVGSIAGTVGGAAIGTAIEPGIGTAIGAALGSVLGGFFGASKVSPPGSTATLGVAGGQLGVTGTGHFGGPGDPGAGPAVALANAFDTNANNFATDFGLAYGQNTGAAFTNITYQDGTYRGVAPGGPGFTDPQAAETASEQYLTGLHSAATDQLEGVGTAGAAGLYSTDPTDVGHAENALLSEVGPSSFTDLAAALQKADQAAADYDAELTASGHAISSVQQQYAQLNQTLATDQQNAEQYLLDPAALVTAFANQFNTSISDQIEAINDPVQAQLDAQARDAQSSIDEATALGADVNQVETLNGLQRQQIVQQANSSIISSYQQLATSAASSASSIEGSMASLQESLTIGSASPLSPTDQFAAATTLYNQTKAGALSGDATSISNYSSAATDYLNLARSVYATTAPYIAAYNDVLATASLISGNAATSASSAATYAANLATFGQTNLIDPNNLPAFAGGGSFTVGGGGGVDSQVVQFRASPWENVTIGNPGNVNTDVAGAIRNSVGQLWLASVQGTQATVSALASLTAAHVDLADQVAQQTRTLNGVMRTIKAA